MRPARSASGRHRALAVCTPGLETICAAEVRLLGVHGVECVPGGVTFAATTRQLYAANVELRTATRVLVRFGSFPAESFAALEQLSATLPWADVLPPGAPVRFRVTSLNSRLYHEDGIAQRIARGAKAPLADDADAQLFVVRIVKDMVTISADTSGELLHRRGYRLATAKAPMRETLAAALIAASGWDGTTALVDPFCGSGTIPVEAAMIARRMAPGLGRAFGVERWPTFEPGTLASVRGAARARVLPAAGVPIVACDRDLGAVSSAKANAERAGVLADIAFSAQPLSELAPMAGAGALVTNPPYGARIGERDPLRDLYAALGQVVRDRLPGFSLTMLSAEPVLDAATGLPLAVAAATSNGGIPVRMMHMDASRSTAETSMKGTA